MDLKGMVREWFDHIREAYGFITTLAPMVHYPWFSISRKSPVQRDVSKILVTSQLSTS
jgi:hypothetical protein